MLAMDTNDTHTRDEDYATLGPIAIIGPPGAGKSAFLASLLTVLGRKPYGYNIEAEGSGDLDKILEDYQCGYFPEKTSPAIWDQGVTEDTERIRSAQITNLKLWRPNSRTIRMQYIDPPGELFNAQEGTRYARARTTYFNTVKGAKGVILVLNPLANPSRILNDAKLAASEWNKHNSTQGQGSLSIPLSVVFTHCDTISGMRRFRTKSALRWVQRYLNSELGDQPLDDTLSFYFDQEQIAYFFTSAVGWTQGQKNFRTVTIRSKFHSADPKDLPRSVPDEKIVYPSPPRTTGRREDQTEEHHPWKLPPIQFSAPASVSMEENEPFVAATFQTHYETSGVIPVLGLTSQDVSSRRTTTLSPFNVVPPFEHVMPNFAKDQKNGTA